MSKRTMKVVAALVFAVVLAVLAPAMRAEGSCCFFCGGHEVCCNVTEACGDPGGGCVNTGNWCRAWCDGDWVEAECLIIQ